MITVPSLIMLALGVSQGQRGGCSLFAASANAAVSDRPTAPAVAATCDQSVPTAEILLGVIGVSIGVSLAVGARRRREP